VEKPWFLGKPTILRQPDLSTIQGVDPPAGWRLGTFGLQVFQLTASTFYRWGWRRGCVGLEKGKVWCGTSWNGLFLYKTMRIYKRLRIIRSKEFDGICAFREACLLLPLLSAWLEDHGNLHQPCLAMFLFGSRDLLCASRHQPCANLCWNDCRQMTLWFQNSRKHWSDECTTFTKTLSKRWKSCLALASKLMRTCFGGA